MVIRDLGGRGISVQDATWYTEKNGRHGGHMVILGRGIVNYIIIVIVGVVIGALLRSSRKHDAQAVDKHEVRENPLLLVLAFPVLVICAVLAWGLDSQSAGIGWTVVVAIFSLLPLSMALAVVNRRITYDDEGFTTRDLVRCSRRFSYCDITGTLAGSDSVTYHMGTHRFRIDDNMVGGIGFKAAASSWARRNGRTIPQLMSPLFGGNVINPGNLVFIYGVWVVCAVGFFSLSYVFGDPTAPPTIALGIFLFAVIAFVAIGTYLLPHSERYPIRLLRLFCSRWMIIGETSDGPSRGTRHTSEQKHRGRPRAGR